MNRINPYRPDADDSEPSRVALATISPANSFIAGLLAALVLLSIWIVLALAQLAPAPSLGLLADVAWPLLRDLGSFVGFNVAHNFAHVLLMLGVLAWFESAFRRCVAQGRSTAVVVGLFKGFALLAGILSLAIALPATLDQSLNQAGNAKTAIGHVYAKFGLWVLAAIVMVVRQIRHVQREQSRTS